MREPIPVPRPRAPVEDDADAPLWLSRWPFREPTLPPPPADDED